MLVGEQCMVKDWVRNSNDGFDRIFTKRFNKMLAKKTSMAKNNIVTKNILNKITLIRAIKTIEIDNIKDSFLTCI